MSINSDSAADNAQFLFVWKCPVSDLEGRDFCEKCVSPAFCTVFDNVRLEWRVYVTPNGIKMCEGSEIKDHLGIFLQAKRGKNEKVFRGGNFWFFVEKQGQRLNRSRAKLICTDESQLHTGDEKYYPKDLRKFESELGVNGVITFVLVLNLNTSVFDWKFMLEREKIGIETDEEKERDTSSVQDWFDDVTCTPLAKRARVEPLEKDKFSIMDFQIVTNDDQVIWCHKLVLVKRNPVFRAAIGSGLKDAQEKFEAEDFDGPTVMELLHFIYKGEVSTNFGSLDLQDILDAANHFNVPLLKLICHEKLIEQLDIENCADMILRAESYNLKVLLEMSVNLAAENIYSVKKSTGAANLSDQHWADIMDADEMIGRVVRIPQSASIPTP